jgi:rod shape-determining protein MreC
VVELTHDSRPIIGRGPPLTAYFLTLAAISIALMWADQRYQQIDRIREVLSAVVHPVQRAVDFPFRATNYVTGSFADRGKLRQENLELTARLRLANLQLQRFAALEDENRRLRDMRAKTIGIADKVLVASILNVDLDPFRHRVLLDKGAVDGVFRGQAVLDGDGIVGQVTKVNAATAEVILISDAEHAIPVQSNRSGVRTIAVGTGDLNRLSLPFVTAESDIQQGDLLLSTGMGGVFPPGYPVGQVSRVKRSGSTFAVVEAHPTAKLDRDREVLLVWFRPLPEPTVSATPTTPTGKPAATAPAEKPAGKPAGTPAATAPANKPGTAGAPPVSAPAATGKPAVRQPTTSPTTPAPATGTATRPATDATPAPPPPRAGDE